MSASPHKFASPFVPDTTDIHHWSQLSGTRLIRADRSRLIVLPRTKACHWTLVLSRAHWLQFFNSEVIFVWRRRALTHLSARARDLHVEAMRGPGFEVYEQPRRPHVISIAIIG